MTLPATGRFTVSLMFVTNGPAVQVAPPAATQVVEQARAAGKLSVTVEPGAALGPAFVATMV